MSQKNKILIIEDNPDISRALEEVLTDMGFHVARASNGKEGMDHLINHDPPAVIILDLFLPVINGIEFRSRQLQIPALAAIPVIAMSADAFVARRCSQMGIRHYLKKPFELPDLIEQVSECLTLPRVQHSYE